MYFTQGDADCAMQSAVNVVLYSLCDDNFDSIYDILHCNFTIKLHSDFF